ncbi:MAG: hypothetical protein Q9197_003531 [Variospora fuerteventurae]
MFDQIDESPSVSQDNIFSCGQATLPAIIGISTQESSKGILDLSNELLALIFDELSRPDLKDVRQTCRALSDLAVSFLFTNAVISAFSTDIDVFKAISRRSNLSCAARTLFNELQHFNHMECYDHRVYEQIQKDFVETHGRNHRRDHLKSITLRVFGSSDPQWKTLPYCKRHGDNLDSVTPILRDWEAAYKRHWELQLHHFDTSSLCTTLRPLPRSQTSRKSSSKILGTKPTVLAWL